jgi:hypothetical protein
MLRVPQLTNMYWFQRIANYRGYISVNDGSLTDNETDELSTALLGMVLLWSKNAGCLGNGNVTAE